MASIKHSRQREAIREFLSGRTDHPTADVIYENLKQQYPNISLGTVYRNLSFLAELGEIQKLTSLGGADHFDGRTDPHFHFFCRECGAVQDIEAEGADCVLQQASAGFEDGQVLGYHVQFFGICADCLKKMQTNVG